MICTELDHPFCEIPLSRGLVSLVDVEDFARLNQHKWHAASTHGKFYAVRELGPRGSVRHILMHREILGLGYGDKRQGDHRNRDLTLDNRRLNLRIATHGENRANGGKHKQNTSGYRGVTWDKERNKYLSHGQYNQKTMFFGRYCTAEEAARVYDRKMAELYGEFAYQNFPGERLAL